MTAAALLAVSACAPVSATRGNYVETPDLEQVQPGRHTRSDVIRLIGSPTTVAPFDDNVWYYLGQQKEKRGVLDPEIKDERVIVVAFDETGLVESVRERDGDRIDIPVSDRATPTHGNDLTIMQQFLGNLGRFNPQEEMER